MKQIKYTLIVLLSALCMITPFAAVAASIYLYTRYHTWWVFVVAAVLTLLSLALNAKMRDLRVEARRNVEYDEFGRSKSKGKYEYLSKKERDQIDLVKTAQMENILNTSAIKKMTKQGPKDPMKELDEMIGLSEVKETVKEMVARMQLEKENRKRGEVLSGRHMVFIGSPGTGKTTVARIMTSFLYQNGYIKENKCIEIDGNFLKAGTESAIKTELVIREAFGGVLFIDEAYALIDGCDGSGEQAIATLIKQMEDNRGKFILILAGYPNEMKELIKQNPGFESRIKDYLIFSDYNKEEMAEIFKFMARQNGYDVADMAIHIYHDLVKKERTYDSFANGRTARNILDKAIDKHALNVMSGVIQQPQKKIIVAEDMKNLRLGGIDRLIV